MVCASLVKSTSAEFGFADAAHAAKETLRWRLAAVATRHDPALIPDHRLRESTLEDDWTQSNNVAVDQQAVVDGLWWLV